MSKDELLRWKQVFIESGTVGSRGGGVGDAGKLAKENTQLRSKLGELLLEKELKKGR